MKIEELEQKVQNILDGFNRQTVEIEGVSVEILLDRYDYKTTHYNSAAKKALNNTLTLHSQGLSDNDSVKAAIRNFRDRSEVAHIDFNIRVLEPDTRRFNRMLLLFDLLENDRVCTVKTEKERTKYLIGKTQQAVALTMTKKNPIPEKLLKQFKSYWASARKESDETWVSLLSTISVFENYNHHANKLLPTPEVTINRDVLEMKKVNEIETKFLETDNSEFETKREQYARPLKFTAPKKLTQSLPERKPEISLKPQPVFLEPEQIHVEFKEFCERLYERTNTVKN